MLSQVKRSCVLKSLDFELAVFQYCRQDVVITVGRNFFSQSYENVGCGYALEFPDYGDSDKYAQIWKNKKDSPTIIPGVLGYLIQRQYFEC